MLIPMWLDYKDVSFFSNKYFLIDWNKLDRIAKSQYIYAVFDAIDKEIIII